MLMYRPLMATTYIPDEAKEELDQVHEEMNSEPLRSVDKSKILIEGIKLVKEKYEIETN